MHEQKFSADPQPGKRRLAKASRPQVSMIVTVAGYGRPFVQPFRATFKAVRQASNQASLRLSAMPITV